MGRLTLVVVLLSATALAQRNQPAPLNGADQAQTIRAALPLDEPRHFCVDLPGHGAAADVTRPFVVHTCKDGMWNFDQRFRWEGKLLRMPQYDLCLAAKDSQLVLEECQEGDATSWLYQDARLRLESRPRRCITISAEASALTQGGRRNPTRYVSKPVGVEACSDEAMERQLFTVVDPLDIPRPLLPPE